MFGAYKRDFKVQLTEEIIARAVTDIQSYVTGRASRKLVNQTSYDYTNGTG